MRGGSVGGAGAGASADESVTVPIDDVTPPVASVDAGGRVTFVNAIKADTVSVSVPSIGLLPAQKASATVHRHVAVTFFGEERTLTTGKQTSWTFPQTTNGSITYTFRIVPQSGLAAPVADQVVSLVRATLDDGGTPVTVPYVVQTILPDLPDVPSVDVPELPSIEVPDPTGEQPPVDTPVGDGDEDTGGGGGDGGGPADGPDSVDGDIYTYGDGTAPQAKAVDSAAARAFDPARFAPWAGSADAASRGSGTGGAGGVAGAYDGASVPVFGRLAGIDGRSLDDQSAGEELAAAPAQTVPASALAAVIALATVTAALVRTSQVSRSSRR